MAMTSKDDSSGAHPNCHAISPTTSVTKTNEADELTILEPKDSGSTSISIPSTSSSSIPSLVRTLDKHIEDLITLQGPETAQWVNTTTFTVNVPRSYTYDSIVQRNINGSTSLLKEIRDYLRDLFLYNKVSSDLGKRINENKLSEYIDNLYRKIPLFKEELDQTIANSLTSLKDRLEDVRTDCTQYNQETNPRISEALGKTLMRFVQLLEQAPPAKEGIADLIKQLDLITQACILKYYGDSQISVPPALEKLLSYITSIENPNLPSGTSSSTGTDQISSAASSAKQAIAQIKGVLAQGIFAFTEYAKAHQSSN